MSSRFNQPWLQFSRIENVLQLEPALIIWALLLLSWLIFQVLQRRGLSSIRKEVLARRFRNVAGHSAGAIIFFTTYWLLLLLGGGTALSERLAAWAGLGAIFWGLFVLLRTAKILISEYFFWGHPQEGVPLLLIEIFTWLLAVGMGIWILTGVFGVNLAPLLATSTALSVVLGFAMQDTLGNVFAGISLQADKPCELGDWIEVHHNNLKWVGQVYEISWRATVLTALTYERIVIPNRVMAQALVSNFTQEGGPILRYQMFRIAHTASVENARKALLAAASVLPEIRQDPKPSVLVMESAESWLLLKLFYYIDDFGDQWRLASLVNTLGVEALQKIGIPLATTKIEVQKGA